MIAPNSFFHVAIKATDLDESIQFYRDHLNAKVIERVDGDQDDPEAVSHAALGVADKRVYLFDQAPYEATGLVTSLPEGFLHFGFVVDDVQATYEELQEADVQFIMGPSNFGDLKIAFFTDPSGIRIELIEYQ